MWPSLLALFALPASIVGETEVIDTADSILAHNIIMSPKNVTRIVESDHVLEGAGFPVRRPIGGRQLDHYGAFLLLDHFGPIEWKPNEAVGAP